MRHGWKRLILLFNAKGGVERMAVRRGASAALAVSSEDCVKVEAPDRLGFTSRERTSVSVCSCVNFEPEAHRSVLFVLARPLPVVLALTTSADVAGLVALSATCGLTSKLSPPQLANMTGLRLSTLRSFTLDHHHLSFSRSPLTLHVRASSPFP